MTTTDTPTLGELIHLMQTARTRYLSLEAQIRNWSRPDLIAESWRRQAARRPRGSTVVSHFGEDVPESEANAAAIGGIEVLSRIWVERPDRWREETISPSRDARFRNGREAWIEQPDGTLLREEYPDIDIQPAETVWDPALLIAELWLDPLARTVLLGREAIEVRARPRPTFRPGGEHFLMVDEADEYELTIDRERGLVLRLASLIHGEVMTLLEVSELHLDRPLDSELFIRPSGSTEN
jgi:hypothetical protein